MDANIQTKLFLDNIVPQKYTSTTCKEIKLLKKSIVVLSVPSPE